MWGNRRGPWGVIRQWGLGRRRRVRHPMKPRQTGVNEHEHGLGGEVSPLLLRVGLIATVKAEIANGLDIDPQAVDVTTDVLLTRHPELFGQHGSQKSQHAGRTMPVRRSFCGSCGEPLSSRPGSGGVLCCPHCRAAEPYPH